jgi:hypothetical protein
LNTTNKEGTVGTGRDRVATILMSAAALAALLAFVGAVGPAVSANPETQVVEMWRMYGLLVFAGLFALLALRPRHYPGVWELVIFHKVALALTAASLLGGETADALSVAVVDGVLAAMTIAAYWLARGYAGWARLRAAKPRARDRQPS